MAGPSRGQWARAAAIAALALPATAAAHGFGRLYNLPVPFWLYAYGATAALIASFVAAGYFLTASAGGPAPEQDLTGSAWMQSLRRWRMPAILRGIALAALLLTIATGFWGNPDPLHNFSMTAFWIVFVLGLAYATALFGDLYAVLNPWQTLARAVDRVAPGFAGGRVAYPAWLGDWPALALYLGFVWLELFHHNTPRSLAWMLTGYTALNLAGIALVGASAWFRHCEFFAVFFRLLSLISPLDYRPPTQPDEPGTLKLRRPFSGLAHERPEAISTLAFALAMLSTTAFDGLQATKWWVGLFWNPAGLAASFVDGPPAFSVRVLLPWYEAWETFWLLASPFLYLGSYFIAIGLAKGLTRSARPLRELALDFGYTLLPIALVYNVTHYATLILTQGLKIVSLLSDPFGRGWNLLGTATLLRMPILPPMGVVWHSQVGLILAGHVASVCVAHVVALRLFPSRRAAMRSQLPMLILMVAFTVVGLWILAQPLTEVLMR